MRGRIVLALGIVALAGQGVAVAKGPIKSHEHTTERAGIKIALWEKWEAGEEQSWRKNGKVILLVHGATWSSRCTFDTLPGYSMMDTLAEAGYDVFAIDLHGYGKSDKSDRDWTEATHAAEDIDAAADYIRAFRWVERIHILGYQWGAQPAGLFAASKPNKVGKVVLFGMRYNLFERKPEPASQYRNNNLANASLKPEDGDLDPDFVRRRASMCAQSDPQSPNGAILDMNRQSPVDPTKLKNATLLIMGDRDTEGAVLGDRLDFYRALTARNKWFVVLPGLGKHASMERGHTRLDNALISFLDQ